MDLKKMDYIYACEAHVDTALLHGKMLISYVRDEKTRQPHGVIIAYKMKNNPEVKLGWSLCHPAKDRWNRYVGISKALERAGEPPTRDSLYADWLAMFTRARKYFADGTVDTSQLML